MMDGFCPIQAEQCWLNTTDAYSDPVLVYQKVYMISHSNLRLVTVKVVKLLIYCLTWLVVYDIS